MNERIRELAEQAGYKPLPGFDFANSLEETYLKKFAQLIVEECANLTLDHKNDDYYTGWLDYRDEIRRHFGIE